MDGVLSNGFCTGIIPAMDKPKRGPGRPPEDDPEDKRYELRLSDTRRQRYERAAAKAGLVLAAWIKRALDRASR